MKPNKVVSTIIKLLLLIIPCKTYSDLTTPAIFVNRAAVLPCFIKMLRIPGFTFQARQQIPPIFVRSYVQTVIGNCTLRITVSGLPEGLTVGNDNTNPVIIGTPQSSGFYLVMVTAQATNNAVGATFPMTIDKELSSD